MKPGSRPRHLFRYGRAAGRGSVFAPSARARGNIFAMLFAAVALTGVLASVGMQTLTGPVTSITRVTQKNIADNNLLMDAKILVNAAVTGVSGGDADSDGIIEPAPFVAAGGGETPPVNGGYLPTTLGLALTDPWGSRFGYCVWDHGSTNSSAGRITGDNTAGAATQPVLAVIAAGPDKVFQTTCSAYSGGPVTAAKAGGSDDLVFRYTYAEATASSNGLWTLNTADQAKAELKDSGGTARVSIDRATGIGDFLGVTTDTLVAKTGTITVDGGLKLDTDAAVTACGAGDAGVVRYNSGTGRMEVCDGTAWKPAGAAEPAGASGDVQFNNGAGGLGADTAFHWDNTNKRLGIGTATPTTRLGITGDSTSAALTLSESTYGGTAAIRAHGYFNGTSATAGIHLSGAGNQGFLLESAGQPAQITNSSGTLNLSPTVGTGITIGNWLTSTNQLALDTTASAGHVPLTITANDSQIANVLSIGKLSAPGALLTMNASGNVGIGTAAPTQKLDVVGNATVSGNVGIGTGTPTAKLHVYGDASTWTQGIRLFNNQNAAKIPIDIVPGWDGMYGGNYLLLGFNGTLGPVFSADGISNAGTIYGAVNIYASGNVGIGTTSPAAKLDVVGGVKIGADAVCNASKAGMAAWNANQLQVCDGTSFKNISAIDKLDDIGDVDAPAPNNNEIIAWDTASGTWKAKNINTVGSAIATPGGSDKQVQFNDGGSLAGAAQLFWDKLNNRLGVNVSAPIQAVDVTGTVTSDRVIFKSVTGASAPLTGSTYWATDGTNVWRAAGRVGVATATPQAALDVAGGARVGADAVCNDTKAGTLAWNAAKLQVCVSTATGFVDIASTAAGASQWTTSGSNIHYNTGNVGIGTAGPKNLLDVGTGTTWNSLSLGNDGSFMGFNTYYSGGWKYKANGYASFLRQDTSGLQVWSAPNNSGGADAAQNPVLAMTISPTGNVGIGTANPGAKLDVAGTARFLSGALEINDASGPRLFTSSTRFALQNNGGLIELQSAGSDGLKVYNTGGVTIDNPVSPDTVATLTLNPRGAQGAPLLSAAGTVIRGNGNVGIGTISPTAPLHLLGTNMGLRLLTGSSTSGYTADIGVNDDGVNFSSNSAARGYVFKNANGTLVTISATGNVGIGTASPGARLDVASASDTQGIRLNGGWMYLTPTRSSANQGVQLDTAGLPNGSNAFYISAPAGWAGNVIKSNLNGVEMFSIRHDGSAWFTGNVGIGTTTLAAKLHVKGNAAVFALEGTDHAYMAFYPDGVGAGRKGYFGFPGASIDNISLDNEFGTGVELTLNTDGSITAGGAAYKPGGGSWAASSDARLKDIDGAYEQGLDSIVRLDTVKFHYRKDNPRHEPSDRQFVGLIAQDVKKVFPEAVTERGDGYFDLDFTPINYALINAIKDLKADNDNLRAELRAANDNLRAQNGKQDAVIKKLQAENHTLKETHIELRKMNASLLKRLDVLEAHVMH